MADTQPGREPLRTKLADLSGCLPDEIAINRNSTEALNTVIFGLNLKEGDEIVLTQQDYPNMINAWKQREKRDGVKLVWINLDLPMDNEKEIVKKYSDAFTDKTKIVHVTHMINWVGQIMPVKAIAKEAHARGIEVLADGAHALPISILIYLTWTATTLAQACTSGSARPSVAVLIGTIGLTVSIR